MSLPGSLPHFSHSQYILETYTHTHFFYFLNSSIIVQNNFVQKYICNKITFYIGESSLSGLFLKVLHIPDIYISQTAFQINMCIHIYKNTHPHNTHTHTHKPPVDSYSTLAGSKSYLCNCPVQCSYHPWQLHGMFQTEQGP